MSVNQFRLFLTLSWIVYIVSIIVWLWTEQYLPPMLQEYIAQEEQAESTDIVFLMVVSAIVLLVLITSYIGLYLWKDWARHLFLSVFILSYLSAPFDTSPYVMTSWAFYIGDLATLFTGMVLAIIYYNEDIRQRFTAVSIPA